MTARQSPTRSLRCAIYTRKSSEEGLEQNFNSIDAQREACEAYILSQRHEGWKVLSTRYDDGGFSGATMDRPALKRLMADIQSGAVDLVVVYKIDRLTRALSDFAKMVEIFDAHQASFVSVTQHFNTTTSMGRLTLNVLLSFAQFEREVTGERIRDKIAASKRKGMWMGGTVPLGYRVEDHKLLIVEEDAEQVRALYHRYLEVGTVAQLQADLDRRGIVSKKRKTQAGREWGGARYSRGALHRILTNRVYLGDIVHHQKITPDAHAPIIDPDLWQQVQEQLQGNSQARRIGMKGKESSLLAGWVFDEYGHRLTPSHANKRGKRYRYYIARPKPNEEGAWKPTISVPAHDLEQLVTQAIDHWLTHPPTLLEDLKLHKQSERSRQATLAQATTLAAQLKAADPLLQRQLLMPLVGLITVWTEQVHIRLRKAATDALARGETIGQHKQAVKKEGNKSSPAGDATGSESATTTTASPTEEQYLADQLDEDDITIKVNARLQRCGLEMRLIIQEQWTAVEEPEPNWPMIKAIARGHHWYQQLITGQVASIRAIAQQENVSETYVSRLIRCGLLAPDIVEAIVTAQAPRSLSLKDIVGELPMDWPAQRRQLKMAESVLCEKQQ